MHLLDVSIMTYQYEKYRDVTHENSNDLGRGGGRESVTARKIYIKLKCSRKNVKFLVTITYGFGRTCVLSPHHAQKPEISYSSCQGQRCTLQ